MGSISKGVADKGGSKREQRLQKKADKAGMSVDHFKAERKDKFKQALADAFGGGNRGLLTTEDPGLDIMRQERKDSLKKDANAVTKTVGGPDAKVGGGADATQPSEDRTDMTSNMGMAFRMKKGYNW